MTTTTRRPSPVRAFRALMGLAFEAAGREVLLFWLTGVLMALTAPAAALGLKLLVDATLDRDLTRALLVAAALAVVMGGLGMLNTLYYLDLLFVVAEKTSAAATRRLMRLMGEIPGIAHHELPEHLRELDLLREEQGRLGWLPNAMAGMVRVAVGLGASLALLVRIDPLLLLLPLLGVGSFLAGRRARDLEQAAAEATAEPERLRRHLFELGTSAAVGKEVRVFGLAGELVARHRAAAVEVARERDRAEWRGALLQSAGAALFGVGYAGAIALVVDRALRGQATVGDVVLTVGLAVGLNWVVLQAVGYGTNLLRIVRLGQRFVWLEEHAAAAALVPAQPAAPPARLAEGIAVEELAFRYPGSERAILDGVSLRLPAGNVVALVGENGAGKTTLVKLLCRFYEPTGGRVLVDGLDLRRIPVEAWRARLSTAFQDFARFELLARETVGVGRIAAIEDRDAVGAALARAGGDDVPRALPVGLDTQLGRAWDGGVELSGGQWQKLALGRTMMRPDPLLVVFDEPAAALDAATEHGLFERIAEAARSGQSAGQVTVLVTHRFSTVRMADLIVVLDGGRVVEQGSHQELVARGGLYAELYELQSRVYR